MFRRKTKAAILWKDVASRDPTHDDLMYPKPHIDGFQLTYSNHTPPNTPVTVTTTTDADRHIWDMIPLFAETYNSVGYGGTVRRFTTRSATPSRDSPTTPDCSNKTFACLLPVRRNILCLLLSNIMCWLSRVFFAPFLLIRFITLSRRALFLSIFPTKTKQTPYSPFRNSLCRIICIV